MKERLGTYTERQGELLQDFIFVMRDFRKTLNEEQQGELNQRHIRIVTDCIDAGLLNEICDIREKWRENRM